MVRWESDARRRLQAAALELFAEHGFDGVTTARIAERAGLTERTFFRHFGDKREVLFTEQAQFDEGFLAGVRQAATVEPMALVRAALTGGGAFCTEERRPWSRLRQTVIDADPRLRERELLKLAGLADALRSALADRGVPETAAAVAAQSARSVFHIAFQQWIEEGEARSFPEIQTAVLEQLREVVAR